MSWKDLKIPGGLNLAEAYSLKYGLSSDYQTDQKIIYSHPEIKSSLNKALSWMTIKPNSSILDIGINNGYEIELIQKYYPLQVFNSVSLIGFDLVEDMLLKVSKEYFHNKNYKFIKGDVASFEGIDVTNGKSVEILDQSIDIVIALTSLQSSSLSKNFDQFTKNLLDKLAKNAQLLIGLPNFHIDSQKNILTGLFNAEDGKIDYSAAKELEKHLTKLLEHAGFQCKTTGEFIKFYYFHKE